MKYFPLVWAALRRKPTRTILTLLSVTVAFALFGVMMGVNASFQRLIDLARQDIVYVNPRFSVPLSNGMRIQIARDPNVAEIGNAAGIDGYYQDAKNSVFITMIDTTASHVWEMRSLTQERLDRLARTRNGVFFSRKAAEHWDRKPGDTFTIISQAPRADGAKAWSFQILDVVDDLPSFPSNGFIIGNYDFFDKSLPLTDQGKPAWFQLVVKDPARADETARAIDSMFANSAVPTLSQSDLSGARSTAEANINVGAVTQRVAAIGLFMILLLTGNGIAQSVRERLGEFAVLKTLGFSDSGVMLLTFAEAAAPCLAGAGLGMVLAAALSTQIPRMMPPNYNLPLPDLSLTVLLETLGSAILVAFLGAIIPAMRLKRLNVTDALAGR